VSTGSRRVATVFRRWRDWFGVRDVQRWGRVLELGVLLISLLPELILYWWHFVPGPVALAIALRCCAAWRGLQCAEKSELFWKLGVAGRI
jgi:hypothetical protein